MYTLALCLMSIEVIQLLQAHYVVRILCIVGYDQEVRLRRKVQHVSRIAPEHWLDDLRQRHKEALFEESFGNLVRVTLFHIVLVELLCPFLAWGNLWVMVLFKPCDVIVSTDYDFFAQKADPAGVVCKC